MKSTKFIKEIKRENCKYEIAKLKSLIKWKLSFGKKRKKREFSHSIFSDDYDWEREDPNALPNDYYFKPTDILLYDLIPKQKLKETKKGLIRLFKKCLTHKYMPAYGSEDDIEKLISGLDQTLHSGNSWYNVGLFDFAYDIELDSFIEHFDIHVRNFSSFHSAFYQLFDEEIYEDKNYRVDVRHAIIICTSNYKSKDEIKEKLGNPIFNRFDGVIRFEDLSIEAKTAIANKELELMDEEGIISEDIRQRLLQQSLILENAREIRKLIKDTKSLIEIRKICK